MAYVYLRTCRQIQAPTGKWSRKAIYKCAVMFERKRMTVRKCIRNVVENGRNAELAKALADWVPSANPAAGTADDRRYTQLDRDTLLQTITDYIRGQ